MVRTPSIESGNAEAFVAPGILTDRYYFLQTQKIEPEISTNGLPVYPQIYLMFDRQEKTIYECTVYNNDFSNKITVNMMQKTGNDEIAFWQKIEAYVLVEAYENGRLKDGKLKEIAARLDVEDNPVIMLVKPKK